MMDFVNPQLIFINKSCLPISRTLSDFCWSGSVETNGNSCMKNSMISECLECLVEFLPQFHS